MRLRKVDNAFNTLCLDNKYFINDPNSIKGSWNEIFDNKNPLHIEIGCGKGRYIIGMAKNFPNVNFIAIEKFDSVLIRTLEEVLKYDLSNLKLVLYDASNITDIFEESEVDTIYLNFSDPWPKTAHAKRRLTSKNFLDSYKKILKPFGNIIQKTDNRGLFEYSLKSFSQNNWFLNNISLDLHKTNDFNVTTEYEEKWSKKGPIYRLEAKCFIDDNNYNLNVRIETKDKFKFAGIEKIFSTVNKENFKEIPAFWESFMKDENGVKSNLVKKFNNEENFHAILSYGEKTTNEQIPYMIGSFVKDEYDLEGLDIVSVEPMTFAIFRCQIDNISDTWKNIFEIWLVKSKYKHAVGPELEVYLGNEDNMVCEIYIPVVLK